MRIAKITNDNAGYKLISIEYVVNNRGRKPDYIHWRHADYKDGELRVFFGSNYITYYCCKRSGEPDFKSAISLIWKDYILISVRKTMLAIAENARNQKRFGTMKKF